jgi:predicted O-methyltransferase YrrM
MPGTIHSIITSALAGYKPYQDFRRGRATLQEYVAVLNGHEAEMAALGLNRDQSHLSGRGPLDEAAFVDGILADLVARGTIPAMGYDKAAFLAYRAQVQRDFSHGSYSTYIFPEEERLVYALAEILRPTSAGVFGSYYGYWGVWMLPAIARANGHVVYLDIDQKVNDLGKANVERLGFGRHCTFVTSDAVAYLERTATTYDFALVDAEGPEEHADPDYRKKYIYYPIFKASLPRLAPKAVVAVHNVLLSNLADDRYFAERIIANRQYFHKLTPLLESAFDPRSDYPTSEGVGVYRRSAPR